MRVCYTCRKEQGSDGAVGRRDTCPSCGSDLHVCLNCKFYDPGSYNDCREPQAERVVQKDRSNFCDYFEFGDSASGGTVKQKGVDPKGKLEDLFKK
ncbi:MAG: hypothetical protein E4H15_01710 [Syntrophobacterales bacterium]|nr:MAG: hypothetical protein E4H15_01710 [Syntrophobacterales bacterium]